MQSSKHEWLSSLVRLIIAFLAIGYLYFTLDWEKFGHLVAQSEFRWLIAAFVAYGMTILLGIYRWQILLIACQAFVPLKRTLQLTMIGLFSNTFLPGMMSGDVVKIFYATREAPSMKPTIVMSVVMERLLGFVAMFLVSTALITSRYQALTSETATRYAVYFYFAFFGVILLMVVLGASKRAVKLIPFRQYLPWQKTLREAMDAYRFFMKHPICFWGGLLLSVMAHFALMLTFYFVSLALKMNLDFWDLAAVLPLVGLVTLIPMTPNGIGIREMAFKHFLVFAGMTYESSVALSLGGFFVILVWNLIGGVVYSQFKSKSTKGMEVS